MGSSCSVKPKRSEDHDSHRTLITDVPDHELLDLVPKEQLTRPTRMGPSSWIALSIALLSILALAMTIPAYISAASLTNATKASCLLTSLKESQDPHVFAKRCNYTGVTFPGNVSWSLSLHGNEGTCDHFGQNCQYSKAHDCVRSCVVTTGVSGTHVSLGGDIDSGNGASRNLVFFSLILESVVLLISTFVFFLFVRFPGVDPLVDDKRPKPTQVQISF
eukprot:gb/GFBE01067025.1/.p1 GENE.gb/GFBE01067025.1/~~gb/GFBE01067025.1/.p1  ORF type:complete len:219 (+),score=15.73 gb/GFBE01067025.1/:1-657(+)